jgi:hypothetical protein
VFVVLAVQSRIAECELPAAPEPVKVIVSPGALLDTARLPEKVVALAGVNVTVTAAIWLGVSVTGAAAPPIVKSVPVKLIALIFTFVFPELISVTVCWLLAPTGTELKFRLFAVLVRIAVELTPNPDKGTVALGSFEAVVASTRLPLAAPATRGLKFTLNVLLFPGPMLNGVAKPPMLKPFPETFAELMTSVWVPVLESLMVCEFLVPTGTLLKFTLLGVKDRVAIPR